MITTDYVGIWLSDLERQVAYRNAKLAEIGGTSNIRSADRMQTLHDDQITSQLGEPSFSKLITGSITLYEKTRAERNKNPYKGDGGTDLLGFDVDVKTSRMRYGIDRVYNLWVRPKEHHPKTCYYLALMYPDKDSEVVFVGWAYGHEIPLIGDRHELRQDKLHSMLVHPFIARRFPLAQEKAKQQIAMRL